MAVFRINPDGTVERIYPTIPEDVFMRANSNSKVFIQIPDDQIPVFPNGCEHWTYNATTNTVEPDFIKIKECLSEKLLSLQKERLRRILDQYGYIDLADVQLYASQNDTEAQALLSWYQGYDDRIWNWIDNTLTSLKTLDEIIQIDIKSVEEEIFNQSMQASPLP